MRKLLISAVVFCSAGPIFAQVRQSEIARSIYVGINEISCDETEKCELVVEEKTIQRLSITNDETSWHPVTNRMPIDVVLARSLQSLPEEKRYLLKSVLVDVDGENNIVDIRDSRFGVSLVK